MSRLGKLHRLHRQMKGSGRVACMARFTQYLHALFSKSDQIHDVVIGLFINRYEFGRLL